MHQANSDRYKGLFNTKTTSLMTNYKKCIDTQCGDIQILNEVLKILDALSQMRFIERISRPVERRIKEEIVEKFAGKMEHLHSLLEKIKCQLLKKKSLSHKGYKDQQDPESTTNQQINWKRYVKKIERKYVDIFIEGSFRFYSNLNEQNKFSYRLRTYNITNWSYNCLQKIQQENKNGCWNC